MADTELLTLPEAARLASKHADDEITPADFLRAAARGAILLKAVCPRNVTMRPCRPGDEPRQLVQGSKPTLPLIACELLSENGRATWRTMDWFEPHVIRIPRSQKVQARIEAVEPREAETAPRQQQASESAAALGAKTDPAMDHLDPAAKGIEGNGADDEGPGDLCWGGLAHSEADQRPQESEHGRTLQSPERHTHSSGDGQAIGAVQGQSVLTVSLTPLHRNYTFGPSKRKKHRDIPPKCLIRL